MGLPAPAADFPIKIRVSKGLPGRAAWHMAQKNIVQVILVAKCLQAATWLVARGNKSLFRKIVEGEIMGMEKQFYSLWDCRPPLLIFL